MAKHDRRIRYQSDAERPVTVSLRIPQALYDRLERYASEHRQTVSELVRDGIEMRLEVEADPRSRSGRSTAEETELQIDGASILRDMQATLARHDTQIEALMQTREQQPAPTGNDLPDEASYSVIHGTTALELEEQERAAEQEPASDTAPIDAISEAQPTVLQVAQNPALVSGETPAYDTSKFYLGDLCGQRHDYHDSGQSLRDKKGECLGCKRQRTKERTQRWRAKNKAQAATT